MDKNLFSDLVSSVIEMAAIEKGEIQPKPENVHRHALPNEQSPDSNCAQKGAITANH